MKNWIGFAILAALYYSFVSGEGVMYATALQVLDWLNVEHGKVGYLGWIGLIVLATVYFVVMERFDRGKAESKLDELIKVVKKSGVCGKRTQNSGYGNVQLEATIVFRDSGFLLQIKQSVFGAADILLVDKKFLTWQELSDYIKYESNFTLDEFEPLTEHDDKSMQVKHR